MPNLLIDGLTFTFPVDSLASKYDEWSFYRKQFSSVCGGSKAVDALCFQNGTTWLIEVKDYRIHHRTKPQDLGDEIASKVRDTLAGLVATKINSHDFEEKQLATQFLGASKLVVVCHIEQPNTRSKLFPQIVKSADLVLKLKQKLKAIDAHPRVVDMATLHPSMGWTVS